MNGCTSVDDISCTLPAAPGCECALDGPSPVKTRLRVGSCSGVLDAPIQSALARGNYERLAVNLNWVQCPPDTSAVTSMLTAGLVDLALMFTEDAVAFIAEGNPLRLCGTYVATPRSWGVYVGGSSNVCCGEDLRGGTLGIPDEKGASLTLSVLGEQQNWEAVLCCPRRPFTSIHRAADAMAKAATRATIWERQSARVFVATGEWELVGQAEMPWPSLVFVASRESLYSKSGAIRHFIDFAQRASEDFTSNRQAETLKYLASRYGLSPEEGHDFITNTRWVSDCEVTLQTVTKPLEHLKRARLIDPDRVYDPARFLAKELCVISQVGALPAIGPSRRPRKQQPEDEDPAASPAPPSFTDDEGPAPAGQPASLGESPEEIDFDEDWEDPVPAG